MLSLFFEDEEVKENGFISSNKTEDIVIGIKGNPKKFYTVMLYDMDAPYPIPDNEDSPYGHLTVTNIKDSDIDTGSILLDYEPLNPSKDSSPHIYSLELYEQPEYIRPQKHKARKNIDIKKFERRHNLVLKDRMTFKSGHSNPNPSRLPHTTQYFKKGHSLEPREEKYCRCVLHVADKQNKECLRTKNWKKKVGGKMCYNPYAICGKSVGTSVGRSGRCGQSYKYETIGDGELVAFADLHHIKVPKPYDRKDLLENIDDWKQEKKEKIEEKYESETKKAYKKSPKKAKSPKKVAKETAKKTAKKVTKKVAKKAIKKS